MYFLKNLDTFKKHLNPIWIQIARRVIKCVYCRGFSECSHSFVLALISVHFCCKKFLDFAVVVAFFSLSWHQRSSFNLLLHLSFIFYTIPGFVYAHKSYSTILKSKVCHHTQQGKCIPRNFMLNFFPFFVFLPRD